MMSMDGLHARRGPPSNGGAVTSVIDMQSCEYELGPITAIRSLVNPGHARRLPDKAGGSRERAYAFLLIMHGAGRIHHYGHDAPLRPGDLVLINEAVPCTIDWEEVGEIVLLRTPPRQLRIYLPSPEYFCGQPLYAGEGIGDGAAQLLLAVLAQLEAGLDAEFRGRVARNLLDTLATAFSIVLDGTLDGSPVVCSRNARVRLYIESNLRDPDLKPASIASSLRLSPRYLRVIFAASKETVSAYLLRRRLEECARELADPNYAHLSITEIAFGWGFNSGPHFTRTFRNHFHVAPRSFRQRQSGRSPEAPNSVSCSTPS